MRVTTMDGRTFEGTALQIVRGMRELSFISSEMNVKQYVEFVKGQAETYSDIHLKVTGETDEELASSLLYELARTGLARGV